MGPTLAPFAEKTNAQTFAAEHGGTVHAFSQIDAQVLRALKEQAMKDL